MSSRLQNLSLAVALIGLGVSSCSDFGRTPEATVGMSVTGPSCDRQEPEFFSVGRFETISDGEVRSHSVRNQSKIDGVTTGLECTVHRQGGDYRVTAFLQLSDADYALVDIDGQVSADVSAESPVTFSFFARNTTYNTARCTLSYATPQQTVQPGTIFARITCANAAIPSAVMPPPNSCDVVTTIRLENCKE